MFDTAPISFFSVLADKAHEQNNEMRRGKAYLCPLLYQGRTGALHIDEHSSAAIISLGGERRYISWQETGELLLNLKNANLSIKSMQSIIRSKLTELEELSAEIQSIQDEDKPLSAYRVIAESAMILRDGGSFECQLIGPSKRDYVLALPINHGNEGDAYLCPRLYLERWSSDHLIQDLHWQDVHKLIKNIKSKNEYFQMIQSAVQERSISS